MREIIEARSRGRVRADVAFRMFCYRIKKYIAAYAAAMGGVDAVFFTLIAMSVSPAGRRLLFSS